jgi:hypothetical protein
MVTKLSIAYDQSQHLSNSAIIAALLDRGQTTEQIIRELQWKGRKVSAGLVRAVRHQLKSEIQPKRRRLLNGFQKEPNKKKRKSKSDRIRGVLTIHPNWSNQQVVDQLARRNISVSANLVRQVRFAMRKR